MSQPLLQISFKAAAELQGARIVKLTAADTINHATAAADSSIGVTRQTGADKDEQANVIVSGVARVEASAAIARGAAVTAAADGKAVTAADGNHAVGFALSAAAADGDFIEVLLSPHKV